MIPFYGPNLCFVYHERSFQQDLSLLWHKALSLRRHNNRSNQLNHPISSLLEVLPTLLVDLLTAKGEESDIGAQAAEL
jgi:hypothetical protein